MSGPPSANGAQSPEGRLRLGHSVLDQEDAGVRFRALAEFLQKLPTAAGPALHGDFPDGFGRSCAAPRRHRAAVVHKAQERIAVGDRRCPAPASFSNSSRRRVVSVAESTSTVQRSASSRSISLSSTELV